MNEILKWSLISMIIWSISIAFQAISIMIIYLGFLCILAISKTEELEKRIDKEALRHEYF